MVIESNRQVDLKKLAIYFGLSTSALRFGDAAALHQVLRTEQGHVSPLLLGNDENRQVKVVVAKQIAEAEGVGVHPGQNTETAVLRGSDLMRFISEKHSEPVIVDFDALEKKEEKGEKKEEKEEKGGKQLDALTLTAKEVDFPSWYSQVITRAELIEYYDISGCYILRPNSYSIWERIQGFFDEHIKALGVRNSYFPMFVSKRALEAEADHIAGFSPEVAWVTKSGQSDLKEPIAIRPTSETIMYPAFSTWIRSHRDLPLKLNQWCSVVRWEFKCPTPFLRTREFLWQEGHTAYATLEEAAVEVLDILDLYRRVYEELLAVPVVKGVKSEKEKFAGGHYTTTVESFIPQTGRGIQGATSHCLGQNFAKMFKIQYEDDKRVKQYVWQNSWGLTTRTIGVMIMVHGDNKGLVLPPRVAFLQVVIVPIFFSSGIGTRQALLNQANSIKNDLKAAKVLVHLDDRDGYTPGNKYNHWELRGIPIRVEIGPKDFEKQQVVLVRRDTGERSEAPWAGLTAHVQTLLEKIQADMFAKAKKTMTDRTTKVSTWPEFATALGRGNLVLAPWCEETACEEEIKKKSGDADTDLETLNEQGEKVEKLSGAAKSLCIPFEQPVDVAASVCIICQKQAKKFALFGRSY